MTDRMDLARFEALVAAYGAMPGRWPEEERAAAESLVRTDPAAAALLSRADAIDALLFAHHVPEPSRTLRTMVIESAPRRRRRLIARARLWWSAAAFAVAAGSGALTGSAATAAFGVPAHLQIYEHDDVAGYDDVPEEVVK